MKQDWENREEYQEHMQAAKAIKQQIQAYELAFNAEEYHLKHAKNAGYVSTEALQWVFGGEVVKVVSKGLQVTTKGLGELGESMKILKGVEMETKLLPEAFNRFARIETKFAEHGSEWASVGLEAYYKRAISLADSKVGGNILGFTSKDGWVFRMNSQTGEFLTIRPDGKIATFFRRLSDPVKYWAEQIAKYGR